MTARATAKRVFEIGAYVLVVAVVLQFFLAGLGIFASATLFFWHTTVNAIVIFFGSIILALLGWYARVDRRTFALPGIIAGLVILQSLLLFPYHMALPTAVRFFSMKLASSNPSRRPSSCAVCKSARSCRWAGSGRSRWTCG